MSMHVETSQLESAGASQTLSARHTLAIDMLDRGAPLTTILTLLCHIVEAEAQSMVRACIFIVDEKHQCLRTGAAPGLPDDFNRAVDGIGIASDIGTCATAAATGAVVVTQDIASDPAWHGIAHLPLGLGLVAAWSMPILGEDGRVIGTFGTYFSERRPPTAHERHLVATLSATAAQAIQRT
jgi:GAF domain-containing protein